MPKPNNSPLVKGKKYRQLKADYQQLQTQNHQLIRELGVLNKKNRDAQKKANELDQLVGEISTERDILEFLGAIEIDCTDENIITIESKNKRIVNLIRIIDQLNYRLALRQAQLNQSINQNTNLTTTVNDYWQLITNFQTELNQTQQDRNNYYNLVSELEQELEVAEDFRRQEQTTHQKTQNRFTNLRSLAEDRRKQIQQIGQYAQQQIRQLNKQLNQARQTNQNLQAQINQIQQQLDQQRQTNIYLESRVKYLKDELAEERGSNYRSQRSNRRSTQAPQWRGSEATLFGDESDNENQAGPSNTKSPDNQVNNPSWKSRFWNSTKKLGLTALATYGTYQTGYHQGTSSNNQLQANCQTPNIPSIYPVFANSTHSWQENPFLPTTHCDLGSPNQLLTFQNSNFTPPPPMPLITY